MATSRKINLIILSLGAVLVPLIVYAKLFNFFYSPKNITIVFIALVLAVLNERELLKLNNFAKALILFNVLNLFYTSNPYHTQLSVFINISAIIIYFSASLLKDIKILLYVIMWTGVLVAGIAWLQYIGIAFFPGEVIGTIGNSNYLGCYLLFPLFATLSLIQEDREWYHFVIFLLLFSVLILTRARASWIGFAVGFTFYIFVIDLPFKKTLLFIIPMTLIVVIMFLNLRNYEYIPRLETLRLRLTKYTPPAVNIIKEHPLFGIGIGGYRNAVYGEQAKIEAKTQNYFKDYPMPKPRYVHNEYLETLVDGGIVYFVVFFGFIFSVLKKAIAIFRKTENSQLGFLISTMIGILTISIFFFAFRLNVTLFMSFLTLGMISALCEKQLS